MKKKNLIICLISLMVISLIYNARKIEVLAEASARAISVLVTEYRIWSYKTGKSSYKGEIMYTCPGGTYPEQNGEVFVDTYVDEDGHAYDRYRLLYVCK